MCYYNPTTKQFAIQNVDGRRATLVVSGKSSEPHVYQSIDTLIALGYQLYHGEIPKDVGNTKSKL